MDWKLSDLTISIAALLILVVGISGLSQGRTLMGTYAVFGGCFLFALVCLLAWRRGREVD